MNLDSCTSGQKTIITTLDKPLMVSAGAGSGKTFTLTQRIAYAFDSGFLTSIDQIVAITFTKKAASELKTRIKKQLLSMGLKNEALRVDDAWISTIHGMCSRILKEHALELGIDPSFEMIDDVEKESLLTEALNEVLCELEENPELGEVKKFAQQHAGSGLDSSIVKNALALRGKIHSLPRGYDSLIVDKPQSGANELLRSLLDLGYEFLSIAQTWKKPTKTDEKMLNAIQDAIEKANSYLSTNATDFLDANFDVKVYLKTLLSFPKTRKDFHRTKEDGAFFESYSYEFAKIASEAQASIGCVQLHKLVRFTQMLDTKYQALKGGESFDDDDLLVKAYYALRDNPSIVESYKNQFKLIMVDEFQDTDSLQVTLLSLLSKEKFGNVATVGDAQQSIYRFRGADVQVFFGYQDNLVKENPQATLVSLPDNFRSHRDILSFVDIVFGQETVFGERFLSLKPRGTVNNDHDDYFDKNPRICVNLFETRRGQSTLDQARIKAARSIADTFSKLREAGVPAGDMVVLLGTLKHVQYYLDALREAGFETTIAGGSVFASSTEATLINSLIYFAANPLDSKACFEVLSSPLFNLSDADLYDAINAFKNRDNQLFFRNSCSHSKENDDTSCFSQALKDALLLLSKYLDVVNTRSVVSALYWIIDASGMWLRLHHAGAEGMANAGNLFKAIGFAKDFSDDGFGTVELAKVYSSNLEALKEAPGVLNTGNSDFVRIMTVHASKGLEFPHVAISEIRLGTSSSSSFVVDNIDGHTVAYLAPDAVDTKTDLTTLTKLLDEESEGSAERVISAQSPGQRKIEFLAYETIQELQEARRLFYVALTRASKSLCVSIAAEGNKSFDYSSKGVLNDLYTALEWDTSALYNQQFIDYGGMKPLCFCLEVLQKQDDPDFEELDQQNSDSFDQVQQNDIFMAFERYSNPLTYSILKKSDTHEVVSYSSLFHDASSHMITVSDTSHKGSGELRSSSSDLFSNEPYVESTDLLFGDDFDDSDDRDAISLGLAFHRLAQRGIIFATDEGLYTPDVSDARVQASHYALQGGQFHRLLSALHRWFNSSLAQEFSRFGSLDAEVPFYIPLTFDSGSFVLEGEIDGLACQDKKAFFVDYKTGGHPEETYDDLVSKHRLQAQCYSYALLCMGYEEVEARFVRVEQQDFRCSGDEPQVISYSFSLDDIDDLKETIVSSWKQIQKPFL